MHSSLVIPCVLQLIMTINACSLKGYSNEYVQTSKIAYFFIQKMGAIFLWEMLQVMHLPLQLVVNLTRSNVPGGVGGWVNALALDFFFGK